MKTRQEMACLGHFGWVCRLYMTFLTASILLLPYVSGYDVGFGYAYGFNLTNLTTTNISAYNITADAICLRSGTCLGTPFTWTYSSYFNQGLNTSSNVSFYNVSVSGNLSVYNNTYTKNLLIGNGSTTGISAEVLFISDIASPYSFYIKKESTINSSAPLTVYTTSNSTTSTPKTLLTIDGYTYWLTDAPGITNVLGQRLNYGAISLIKTQGTFNLYGIYPQPTYPTVQGGKHNYTTFSSNESVIQATNSNGSNLTRYGYYISHPTYSRNDANASSIWRNHGLYIENATKEKLSLTTPTNLTSSNAIYIEDGDFYTGGVVNFTKGPYNIVFGETSGLITIYYNGVSENKGKGILINNSRISNTYIYFGDSLTDPGYYEQVSYNAWCVDNASQGSFANYSCKITSTFQGDSSYPFVEMGFGLDQNNTCGDLAGMQGTFPSGIIPTNQTQHQCGSISIGGGKSLLIFGGEGASSNHALLSINVNSSNTIGGNTTRDAAMIFGVGGSPGTVGQRNNKLDTIIIDAAYLGEIGPSYTNNTAYFGYSNWGNGLMRNYIFNIGKRYQRSDTPIVGTILFNESLNGMSAHNSTHWVYESFNESVYGSLYGNEIGFTYANAPQNQWNNITSTNIATGKRKNVNQLYGNFTVNQSGDYSIVYDLAVEVSSPNKHVQSGIMVNGVTQNDGISHVEMNTASAQGTMGGNAILSLTINDRVSIALRTTDTGTPNIEVDHISVTIQKIN